MSSVDDRKDTAVATRNKESIEAEIAEARERLAGNIEGLISQFHPKAVVNRGVQDAKQFAQQEFRAAKQQVVYDTGEIRYDRVAFLVGAFAGAIAFLMIIRKLVRR